VYLRAGSNARQKEAAPIRRRIGADVKKRQHGIAYAMPFFVAHGEMKDQNQPPGLKNAENRTYIIVRIKRENTF
jgi:hypothetical protein